MRNIWAVVLFCNCLISCSDQSGGVDKPEFTGNDYRLFQHTQAWPLAQAVRAWDVDRIGREILENKIGSDYQDGIYGNTLLMMAIVNGDYLSVKALLDAGANPNLRDSHRGTNAVIDAAVNDDIRYLKLVLAHSGDPNVAENILADDDDSPLRSALTAAISYDDVSSFEKVKLLIESGADVNYPSDSLINAEMPLGVALKRVKMDIALYLLESGADFQRVMYKTIDGKNVFILTALRRCVLDLQSPDYLEKQKIVRFLSERGVEYYDEPIPEFVVDEIKQKYPDTWREYLKKY